MNDFSRILIALLFFSITLTVFSQSQPPLTDKLTRWQHLDLNRDSVYGISMDMAYNELLKNRKKKIVIVAVIDSGTDTLNIDLKPVLWLNKKEKGSDEDHNGYRNDRHGWNFLGVKEGNDPLKPGLAYQRTYLSLKHKCSRYSDQDITMVDKDCKIWLSVKEKFKADSAEVVSLNLSFWKQIANEDNLWRETLGKEVYVAKDIKEYEAHNGVNNDNSYMLSFLSSDSTRTNRQQLAAIEASKVRLLKWYSEDPVLHRSETIGDDYTNIDDKFYGNPYVKTNNSHGTHVANIIGAARNNHIGIDGIANAVQIMPIRAVPTGVDEYDKDVALAIRYAVDNGAKVINMSFGKAYSLHQKWVEEAIQYAAKKDVLIIHAAGNDAGNTDSTAFYPTSKYLNGSYAPNVITVGASGATRENLIAPFSNYGKQTVDVFAPGLDVYSAGMKQNGLEYEKVSGTSIASPVVAGLACVLRSCYPKLSAEQIKYIIESSVTKIDGYIAKPGKENQQVLMTELCRSGGIVNAYNAVQMAENFKRSKWRKKNKS